MQVIEKKREQQKHQWDDFILDFLRPVTMEMIYGLSLKPNDAVLDVATGTGEPGLTMARLVSTGKVIGADISGEMLRVATRKVKAQQISNFSTQLCAAGELPFADQTFDKITCRMGFMYFRDMLLAAQQLYRVLQPGGRIALAVWGTPEKNQWIQLPTEVASRYQLFQGNSNTVPNPFRASFPGYLTRLLRQAGFREVQQKEVTYPIIWDSKEQYWQFVTEIIGPVVHALMDTDDFTKNRIKYDLFKQLSPAIHSGKVMMPYTALVLSACK